ncbi:hypothetical protein Tco_0851623 [Tanacetum coccineum]
MAKNANPLAFVATAQTLQEPYYQTSKPHKSYAPTSKASLPTRSHATTRYKGKEIAKPITPPSESVSEEDINELRAERMAKNANPLALVATAQTLQDPYYQTSKPHKSYAPTSRASLPPRSHATTRYKGKEIAKPITPSEEDSDPEQAQKDKDMQKNLALIAKYFKKLYKPTNNNLRTSSNTRNKNVVRNYRFDDYKTHKQK